MKWILLLMISSLGNTGVIWHNDLEVAKKEASSSSRLVLLNFSGSDWCGPCMRLKQEVFASEAFGVLADKSLVLCNADFPRSKKNQLSKEQQQRNEAMADAYNPKGKFPFTVLLDASGKVLRSWEGYPQANKQLFIDQLTSATDANHH